MPYLDTRPSRTQRLTAIETLSGFLDAIGSSGYIDDVESDRALSEKDLYILYGDYRAVHATQQLADDANEQGDIAAAARWQALADARSPHVIGDMVALEINVFLVSRLLNERLDIVGRLRNQSPPTAWSTLGSVLGTSKQAAHEWFIRGRRRPRVPNPTEEI